MSDLAMFLLWLCGLYAACSAVYFMAVKLRSAVTKLDARLVAARKG